MTLAYLQIRRIGYSCVATSAGIAMRLSEQAKWMVRNVCQANPSIRTAYPELFAVIGAKVPDYRGLFLRGYGQQSHSQNNGSTVGVTSTTHKSGALGEVQGDAIRNIYGKFSTETPSREMSDLFTQYDGPGDGNGDDGWSADPRIIFDASRVVPTATENRPVNVAVRYFIRAR